MSGQRLDEAEILRGGANVRIIEAPPSSTGLPELGPAISEDDAAHADLFRPRLIEFGETREETIVSARPFVREELVVGRSVGRRVERIDETVRRTEVEVEDLSPRTGEEHSEPPFAAAASIRIERGTQ